MKNKLLASIVSAGLMMSAASTMAAGDAANGEKLAAACAACHGADGNSPSPIFPKIAGLGEKYLTDQLKQIRDGSRAIPEMAGQLDGKSDQDLADMAAFFSSKTTQLAGAKEGELKLNSGEVVSTLSYGEKVYRSGNLETKVPACTGCHSPTGQGNAPAGFPRLSGQYAEYIEKQLFAFRTGERATDGEARIMRSVAEHMSDAEIKAVAAYIAGLN
ncbi:cytochrome c [Agaribacterium sp. ZY112]|uniref:c-type cytochrome n=1 Tax=Agaribacterium sp. ZY112 TaxID=3233574 RepID=UPI003525143B